MKLLMVVKVVPVVGEVQPLPAAPSAACTAAAAMLIAAGCQTPVGLTTSPCLPVAVAEQHYVLAPASTCTPQST
jgi:hypothetical protein